MAEHEMKDIDEQEEARHRKKAKPAYDQLKQAAEPEESKLKQAIAGLPMAEQASLAKNPQAQGAQRAEAMLNLQQTYGNKYVQRLTEGDKEATLDEDTIRRIEAQRGSGTPLEPGVCSQMETVFKHDFGAVKVHTDSEADRLSQELSANAFTTGKDIFFRESAYQPASENGLQLIAHELTHVWQQEQSSSALTVQRQAATGQTIGQAVQHAADMELAFNLAEDSQNYLNFLVDAGRVDPDPVFRNACQAIRSGKARIVVLTPHPDSATIVQQKWGPQAANLRAYFIGFDSAKHVIMPLGTVAAEGPSGDLPTGVIGIAVYQQIWPTVVKTSKDDIRTSIKHEFQHTLQPDLPGPWATFVKEFQAYWVDGRFDRQLAAEAAKGLTPEEPTGIYTPQSPPIPGGVPLEVADPNNPLNIQKYMATKLNRKAWKIIDLILRSGAYPLVAGAFFLSQNFRDAVMSHNNPGGIEQVVADHINKVWESLDDVKQAMMPGATNYYDNLRSAADAATASIMALTMADREFIKGQIAFEKRSAFNGTLNKVEVQIRNLLPEEVFGPLWTTPMIAPDCFKSLCDLRDALKGLL